MRDTFPYLRNVSGWSHGGGGAGQGRGQPGAGEASPLLGGGRSTLEARVAGAAGESDLPAPRTASSTGQEGLRLRGGGLCGWAGAPVATAARDPVWKPVLLLDGPFFPSVPLPPPPCLPGSLPLPRPPHAPFFPASAAAHPFLSPPVTYTHSRTGAHVCPPVPRVTLAAEQTPAEGLRRAQLTPGEKARRKRAARSLAAAWPGPRSFSSGSSGPRGPSRAQRLIPSSERKPGPRGPTQASKGASTLLLGLSLPPGQGTCFFFFF